MKKFIFASIILIITITALIININYMKNITGKMNGILESALETNDVDTYKKAIEEYEEICKRMDIYFGIVCEKAQIDDIENMVNEIRIQIKENALNDASVTIQELIDNTEKLRCYESIDLHTLF